MFKICIVEDDLKTADLLKAAFNKQLLPNDYPVEFKIVEDNKKTMLPVIAGCPSVQSQAEFVVREILNIKDINRHSSVAVLYRYKRRAMSLSATALSLRGLPARCIRPLSSSRSCRRGVSFYLLSRRSRRYLRP